MAESMIINADEAYESQQESEIENDDEVSTGVAEESVPEDDLEIEVEGKKTSVESTGGETTELKRQIRELQDELLRVSARVQQPLPEVKTPPKEETLTRAQLAQIVAENSDKPEVLLNVIDYIAEQKTKTVKEQAFEELSASNWHREIAGNANQILSEDKDGYISANPDVKNKITQVVKNMKWEDHPAGPLAAYALIRFGEGLAAKSQQEPKKEVSKGKMDKTRLLQTPSKTKKLTPEQLEMAKKLGLKDPNLMARFIP